MSEPAVSSKVAPIGSVKPLQVHVAGKITRVRRHEKFFYTTIICPAKDEYSRPSVVEIRSKNRFGDVEETTKVNAELGGYEGKAYAVTDRETGERKNLVPVNLFLDLLGE
jgi:hypothetical protein